MNTTVALDADDLTELTNTGTLWFPLGNQRIELHTQPRPDADPLAIQVKPEHLEALHEHGQVAFRRDWGRIVLTLAPALVVAR